MSIITIKRIKKKGWASSTGERYPGTTYTLCLPLDARTGSYKKILNSEEVKELEKEIGESLSFRVTNTFWRDFKSTFVAEEDKILDLSDPMHRIEYALLLASEEVANNELERHNNPKAKWVIFNEEKEAEEKLKATEIRKKGYKILDTITPEEIREMLLLIGQGNGVERLSNNVVEKRLVSWVEDEDNNGKNSLDRFRKLILLYEDKYKNDKVFLAKLVKSGLFRKRGNSYFYNQDLIGDGEDLALAELRKNKELRKGLEAALKEKEK